MYGKGFLTVLGFVAVILLVVALMTAFPALLAVAIGLVLGSLAIYAFATRRSAKVGGEHGAVAEERRQAGQSVRPGASGAPRSGEGDAEAAHRVRVEGRSS